MKNQNQNIENRPYKIVFRKIKCKINLPSNFRFGLVIRIGKISSKYTNKKQSVNSVIEFDETLEVSVDEKMIVQNNNRKEKCQVMLYKYKMNKGKQSKELVGMASMAITPSLFDQELKRLRLTNSFDREAYVESQVKIALGEADILQQPASQISSYYVHSDAPSGYQFQYFKDQINSPSAYPQFPEDFGPIQGDRRSSLNNSFISSVRKQEIGIHSRYSGTDKNQRINNLLPSPIHKLQQNHINFKSNKNFQQQNNNSVHLIQICRQLQCQNQFLMSKIGNLQSHILKNKGQEVQLESPVSKNSQTNSHSHSRSPMIKKNMFIKSPKSNMKVLHKQSNSTDLTQNIEKMGSEKKIQQNNKIEAPSSLHTLRVPGQMQSIRQAELQYSPASPFKNTRSHIHISDQIKYNESDLQHPQPFSLTFGGSKKFFKPQLIIQNVITVAYNPPPPLQRQNTDQSVINHSVSGVQKNSHSRSYVKFRSKQKYKGKKYKLIGSVKNEDSHLSYMDSEASQSQKPKEKAQKQPLFSLKEALQSSRYQQEELKKQNQTKSNMDFIGNLLGNHMGNNALQSRSNNIAPSLGSIMTPQKTKQNLIQQPRLISRATFQQLDQQTEQRYRKNQRILKKSNQQLLEQNKILAQEKKKLQFELEGKKQLSSQHFQALKQQIQILRDKIKLMERKQQQKDQKIIQLSKRCQNYQNQNNDLKKTMKQQRKVINQYKKLLYQKDDKEKEENQKKNPNQEVITQSSHSQASQANKSPSFSLKNSIMRINSMEKTVRVQPVQYVNSARQSNSKVNNSNIEKTYSEYGSASDLSGGIKPTTSSKAIMLLKSHKPPKTPSGKTGEIVRSKFQSKGTPSNSSSQNTGNIFQFLTGLSGSGATIHSNNPTKNTASNYNNWNK